MKRLYYWLALGCLVAWLVGCSTLAFPSFSQVTETPTGTMELGTTPVVDVTPGTSNGSNTVGTQDIQTTLVLWVAPQFDPEANTPAALLFKARLEAFTQQYSQINIDVRVKAETGTAGLIESLTAANAVAPDALPDLVTLDCQQLDTAGIKGLLTPYDGFSTMINESDWYPYAREMASVQGSQYGMPFSGDALVLAFWSEKVSGPFESWDSIFEQKSNLVFPAADPEGLLTTAFYLAEGGEIEDDQGRPGLQTEALTRVLEHYQVGSKDSVFPSWITDFSQDDQAWQVYREQRSPMAFTWVSHLLSNPQTGTALTFLPGGQHGVVSFADGWSWALAGTHSEKREMAVRLAEFLVEPNYLAAWSEAAGTLPPRSKSLDNWSNSLLQPFLNDLSTNAELRPDEDTLITIGPALKEAAINVIQGQAEPVQAAQTAVDSLSSE